MQLVKPPWINHGGGAIYSLDIHPSGKKVVTCGQGSQGGSGVVNVWNLTPVLDEKAGIDENVPKLLSRMLHTHCVNCVRWSKSGQYLACGGDERVVTVWQLVGMVRSAGTIGADKAVNIEQYKCLHRLNGHSMDVLHLEWSPTDNWLVSCSVDNTAIVWDANRFPEKVATLSNQGDRDGHKDIVKGLSWDPIGRYLATQSSDKTVKIWSTNNWQCVKTLWKPFEESSHSTMFARHDWSPDGAHLLTPCSMNNGGPTAQIFLRNNQWDTERDLVGHRRAVTCVRACSRLFEHKTKKGKLVQVACFAAGSRDKAVSIWLIPKMQRPIVVLQDLFKHSVLDISWNGLHFMACSMDGTVASVRFAEKELGRMLSTADMGDVCQRLYSTRPSQYSTLTNGVNGTDKSRSATDLIDDPSIMKLRFELQNERVDQTPSMIAPATPVTVSAPPPMASATVTATPPNLQQTETRTKDGKRRIMPIFLGSTVTPLDTASNTSFNQGSSLMPPPTTTASPSTADGMKTPSPVKQVSQTISIAASASSSPKKKAAASSTLTGASLKRKADEQPSSFPPAKKATTSDGIASTGTNAAATTLPPAKPRPYKPIDLPAVVVRAANAFLLDLPERRKTLSVQMQEIVPGSRLPDAAQVENDVLVSTDRRLSRLSATRNSQSVWTALIDQAVACIGASSSFVCCGCFDRTVHVFATLSGRSLRRLVVDSLPTVVNCAGNHLMVVTVQGTCSVWDLENGKVVLSRESLADIIDNGVSIVSESVTSRGLPLFCLSNGKSFTYSLDMRCWEPLLDTRSSLAKLSDSIPTASSQGNVAGAGPVASLLAELSSHVAPSAAVNASLRSQGTQTALECRLQSAASLNSPMEYRFYLQQYVQRLVNDGAEGKLRQVFDELIDTRKSDRVVGLSKKALIKETLPILKASPHTQRLFADIERKLSDLTSLDNVL